jgi:hypothetical protein
MPDDEPSTEQLQSAQLRRELSEREQAREASDDTEQLAHARRAEKASYLLEKLEERERSEQETDPEDDPTSPRDAG